MPRETSSDPVPMPARLVERALDLARAEVGLALVHTRRIVVRAVTALLATLVACAFAQLAILLLVAWPVLAERVPAASLLASVGISVLLALGGGISAAVVWLGARERKPAQQAPASADAEGSAALGSVPPRSPSTPAPAPDNTVTRPSAAPSERRMGAREAATGATFAERVSS